MGSLTVVSTYKINATNETNSTRVLFEISFQLNSLQGQFIVWKQQKHKYNWNYIQKWRTEQEYDLISVDIRNEIEEAAAEDVSKS